MITTFVRRLAIALVAVAGLAGFVAVVPWQEVPVRPVPAADHISVNEAANTAGLDLPLREQTTTVSGMSAPAPAFTPAPGYVPGRFDPFPYGDKHSAFPTIARLADGRFVAMWRRGSAHISDDGEILRSVSDPDGRNWSEPTHVVVDNGDDVRDPHLGPSGLSTVNGELFLTYFVSVNGKPSGARVARSTDGGETFEPSVRIDPGYPYAAISAPVVRSPNGKLWTGFYGRQNGETVDSAYAAWSADNGKTWGTVRIAIGASGNPYQEPWAVINGSTVLYVFRDGPSALASRSVPESGSGWSAVHNDVLTSATGNSAMTRASNGRVYLVYRHATTRAAMLASSTDGVSWSVERTLMDKPETAAASSVGMTYGHPFEPAPGHLGVLLGMEFSNTESRLFLGFV
jgi:hypothetical protein